jgi:hypothetical protein
MKGVDGMMRKMVLFMLLCGVLMMAGQALAHPPSGMEVTFDPTEGVLHVTIAHSVGDPGGHYISEIRILRAGTDLLTKTYAAQTTKKDFEASYPMPELQPGDVITLEAKCNKFGSMKKDFTL